MERLLRELEPPKLTYRLNVRLTEEEGKRIGELAKRFGKTRTDVVRALLRLALDTLKDD